MIYTNKRQYKILFKYMAFYFLIVIMLAWNSGFHSKFKENQVISNRLYTEEAITFILQDPTEKDMAEIFNTLENNQILWKEDSTAVRGLYYKNGINLPLIEGCQFDFTRNVIHNSDSILAGKNIDFYENHLVLGRLGILNRDSCLDDYIFYPLTLETALPTSKFVLDGFNVQKTINRLLMTDMGDKLYLNQSKTPGSFNAYSEIRLDYIFVLSYISILMCSLLVSLAKYEQRKPYYHLCRLLGISSKRIFFKTLKKEAAAVAFSVLLGCLIIFCFSGGLIFRYSMIKLVLNFGVSVLINFLICIIFMGFKIKLGDKND